MIGTRHMRMLAELVAKGGGTLSLIGDPGQLPAVDSTPPLQALTRRYPSAALTHIQRQKAAWARRAAKAFAQGNVREALQLFAEKHCITVRDSIEEAIQQACLDWTEEGLLTPHRAAILANTNDICPHGKYDLPRASAAGRYLRVGLLNPHHRRAERHRVRIECLLV